MVFFFGGLVVLVIYEVVVAATHIFYYICASVWVMYGPRSSLISGSFRGF